MKIVDISTCVTDRKKVIADVLLDKPIDLSKLSERLKSSNVSAQYSKKLGVLTFKKAEATVMVFDTGRVRVRKTDKKEIKEIVEMIEPCQNC